MRTFAVIDLARGAQGALARLWPGKHHTAPSVAIPCGALEPLRRKGCDAPCREGVTARAWPGTMTTQ